jgi:WbqC-like protein
MKLIIENQYFSPISLFSALRNCTHIIFEQYDVHHKMTFRNRCIIAGANGPISLSIPLEGGRNQKIRSRDLKISHRYNWQIQHWKSIQSSYNKAPWFEFYSVELKTFYNTPYQNLFEWNLDIFKWVIAKLNFNLQISITNSNEKNYSSDEFIDLRNQILPRNYSLIKGPEYQQVFMDKIGFINNISILDLLLCKGKHAGECLK